MPKLKKVDGELRFIALCAKNLHSTKKSSLWFELSELALSLLVKSIFDEDKTCLSNKNRLYKKV